jgi:hypothetical protein
MINKFLAFIEFEDSTLFFGRLGKGIICEVKAKLITGSIV